MRTVIVTSNYSPRFTDKDDCKVYCETHNLKPCHLLLIRDGLQCTFGYGAYNQHNQLIGYHCGDARWL